MPVTPLPIASGFYQSSSLPVSAQECTNYYPHIPDASALSQEVLFGTPGITQIATSGPSITDANRGSHRLEGKPYFVNGNSLFRLNADHSLDNLGTIEATGRVWIADNGNQMMILVPDGKGYIFTESPDTLQEIIDTDFTANGNPQAVVFIDGYFCCTTDEKKFIISALNDGVSWNALDFGTAESSPDGVVVPIVYKNQLFIGGERTIEAFNNIGGTSFPFQRTGLFLDEGVMAAFSVVSAENTFMFIGGGGDEGPAVWALSGNQTQKVSSQAIDKLLLDLTADELSGVFAWSYGQSGHYFVGFVLPDTTVVYDTTTARWHERKSRIERSDKTFDTLTCRVTAPTRAYGKTYTGDSQDGRIGVMDLSTYFEYTGEIVRTFATQPFQNNMQPFFVPYVELTVESGVGNTDKTDPQMRMQVSRDGGKTWSDERARSMGEVGEYDTRCIWRRNGRAARFDVYRFTMSAPVKPVVIQLTADIKGGQGVAA